MMYDEIIDPTVEQLSNGQVTVHLHGGVSVVAFVDSTGHVAIDINNLTAEGKTPMTVTLNDIRTLYTTEEEL